MKSPNGKNDGTQLLIMFAWFALFALLPPVAVVVFFCFLFSDGTVPGFVGCLTPFVILVLIALVSMIFQ